MDIFDKLFGAGPAVIAIMKLGFMPKDSDFYELTSEQYESYYKTEGYTDEKIYVLLPNDNRHIVGSDFNEIMVFSESDIETVKRGWQIVECYCERSGREFSSDYERLEYAASKLPNVFSAGTPFEYAHETKLRVSCIAK